MESKIIKLSSVEDKIISLRGINVILDTDVAALYGLETTKKKKKNEVVFLLTT